MNVADVVVLLAYASLLVELTVFPIPSEASTLQLLTTPAKDGGDALHRARQRSTLAKLLLFGLPTAIGVVLFMMPLACALFLDARTLLGNEAGPAWVIPGLALTVLGRTLTFGSVLQLRAWRVRGGSTPAGLFRWSRNPGLVGMYTCYVGMSLVYLVPWMWVGLPLYVGNMHQRVLMEESRQLAELGDRWRLYTARVPRYLGIGSR